MAKSWQSFGAFICVIAVILADSTISSLLLYFWDFLTGTLHCQSVCGDSVIIIKCVIPNPKKFPPTPSSSPFTPLLPLLPSSLPTPLLPPPPLFPYSLHLSSSPPPPSSPPSLQSVWWLHPPEELGFSGAPREEVKFPC